jgi:hypothetical protein
MWCMEIYNMRIYWRPSVFFILSILCCSWSGHDPQEDSSKFGYKLIYIMKGKVLRHLGFSGYFLEPCIQIWQSVSNFSGILGIENLKNTSFQYFYFWVHLFGYECSLLCWQDGRFMVDWATYRNLTEMYLPSCLCCFPIAAWTDKTMGKLFDIQEQNFDLKNII